MLGNRPFSMIMALTYIHTRHIIHARNKPTNCDHDIDRFTAHMHAVQRQLADHDTDRCTPHIHNTDSDHDTDMHTSLTHII